MEDYTLSFDEAVSACFRGEGFIRGENFQPGYYVRTHNDVLVIVNSEKHHQITGNLVLSKGVYEQRFKLFSVANDNALGYQD